MAVTALNELDQQQSLDSGPHSSRCLTAAAPAVLRHDEALELLEEDCEGDVVSEDDRPDGLAVCVHLSLAGVEARQEEAGLARALVAHNTPRPWLPRLDQRLGVCVGRCDRLFHVCVARVLEEALHSGGPGALGRLIWVRAPLGVTVHITEPTHGRFCG